VVDLLLDACVALNLLASDVPFGELASASDVRFVMTSVAASETLWLEPVDLSGERELINDEVLAARGVALVTLGDIEMERFVELAQSLDDGEAATIAVAVHRRLRIATDDRRAVRVAAGQSPPIEVVRTTQLIKRWADTSGADEAHVSRAVRAIQRRANYVPPPDDPCLGWWNSIEMPIR
jgi:hypothetical protein